MYKRNKIQYNFFVYLTKMFFKIYKYYKLITIYQRDFDHFIAILIYTYQNSKDKLSKDKLTETF